MLILHTLGTARIDAGTTRLTPTSVRKFALLLHLSAEPGRRVPREVLRDLIFPDRTEDSARHSLRELVYGFRQLGVRIDSDKHGMSVSADAVASDYRELLDGERPDSSRLTAAAGGFLPGYAPDHSEAYTEWLEGYRARATFEICKVLLKELTRAKRGGDWAQAERAARACLALDPLNEEATLGLAEMLAIGGSKVAAVRLLDAYVAEVGRESGDLTISATILRRRIGEREGEAYNTELQFPFAGRGDEMARLCSEFDRAKHAGPRAVMISGVAGIGKSRLATEFSQLASLKGARVEKVTARPNRVRQPLSAFVELVPKLLALPGALGCAAETLQRLKILTGESEVADPPESDASLAMARAVEDLICSICDEHMLILVLEDAHWLDTATFELLLFLTGSETRRLLILLTSRESATTLQIPGHVDNFVELALAPLSNAAIDEIIKSTVGACDGDLARWIADTAAGNPLFLSNLVTQYRSTGERLRVPPTLSELLRQRVTRIPVRALNVLRMCVVLGKHCTGQMLRTALGIPEIDLLDSIADLEARDILRCTEGGFAAAHALIDETVLAGCTPTVLSMLHRRAAEVLETQAEDSSAAVLWDCAEHWIAAQSNKQALAVLFRCAEHARRIGQLRDAALVLERAFDMCDGEDQRASLSREIVLAHTATSEMNRAAKWSYVARRLSPTIEHDAFELAELRSYVFGSFDLEAAEHRLLACVESSADDHHRLEAGTMIAILAEAFERREPLERVRAAVNRIASRVPAGDELALRFELMSATAMGEIDQARAAAQAALRAIPALEPITATRCHFTCAIVLWRAGLLDEALLNFEASFVKAQRAGVVGTSISLAGVLAGFLYTVRSYELARQWIAAGEQIAAKHPHIEPRWDFLSMRAYIALQDGNLPQARRSFEAMPTLPANPLSRLRRWYDAFRALIDLADGHGLSSSAIDEFIERSKCDNGSGIESDLEIEAVWHGLRNAHRPDAANHVIAEHIERAARRRIHLSHGLQRIAQDIGMSVAEAHAGVIRVMPRSPTELIIAAAAVQS